MTLIHLPRYCTWSKIVYYHFHVTPQQNQIHAFFSCNINWQMWCTCCHLSLFEVNGQFPSVTSMAHIWLGWTNKTTTNKTTTLKPPTICKDFLKCCKCKIVASWFESCLIWGKVPPLHCYLKVCGCLTCIPSWQKSEEGACLRKSKIEKEERFFSCTRSSAPKLKSTPTYLKWSWSGVCCVLMPAALQPCRLLRGVVLITQTNSEHPVPMDRQTKDKVLSAFISLNTL